MLITISRQYGAGGSEVARLVADQLGWTVVDNEIVDRVARRAGLAPRVVAEQDERVPGFVERLAQALTASSQEFAVPEIGVAVRNEDPNLVRLTELVVHEVAEAGKAVLVGRAAPAVLGRDFPAIHVKLVADKAFRVKLAMESEQVDEKTALRKLAEIDANRARYHKEHYNRDWNDPVNFHLTLNTGMLGLDGAAEVIVAHARRLGW